MSSNSIPLSELEASPAFKWERIGQAVAGRITSMDERQQTDLQGRPVNFPSGDPQMVWVITLEQANGESVAVYARGGKFNAASGTGDSMLAALGKAVRAAGATAVDVGAELAIAHTGMGEASPGKNPPRLFTAQYRPPSAPSVPVDLFSS